MIKRLAGFVAFLLIASPAAADIGGGGTTNTTATVSTSSSSVFNDTTQIERVDTFLTRITARIDGGATVYDQSFNLAFGSATVQAAVAAAQAALNGALDPDPTIVGPTLVDSDTQAVSTITQLLNQILTDTQFQVSTEVQVGPSSVITGDRDIGGVLFIVPAGTVNVNVNTHTTYFYDRFFLQTDTYLTTQHYELVGYPQQVVAGVPEPASLALLAFGLGGMAAWRRQSARRG